MTRLRMRPGFAFVLALGCVWSAQHEVIVHHRPFSFPVDQWPTVPPYSMGTLTKPLHCDHTRVNTRMIWVMLTSGQLRQRCPTLTCTEWSFFQQESEIWERGKSLGIPVKKLPNGHFLSANQERPGNITRNNNDGCDSYQELLFSSEIAMVQDAVSKQVYTLVDLKARCGIDYHQPILHGYCRNHYCCVSCTSRMECVPKFISQKFLVEGDQMQIYVKEIFLHSHCECGRS